MTLATRATPRITGGYSQPIIMSLTPWQSVRVGSVEARSIWPPAIDAERVQALADYTALIENQPQMVFNDLGLSKDQEEKIVVAAALPELLCNVWADSVWSDPPTIELPSDAAQTAWEAIDEANDWTELGAWESVFGAAGWGTSVVRLYRSEQLAEQTGSLVQIEEIDPAIYFPILRAGSSRLVEMIVLAWEEDRAGIDDTKSDLWQIRELHQLNDAGRYEIVTQQRKPPSFGSSVAFATVNVETTDLDFLPFIDMHAARWRGRFWGMSELARNLTVFDDIDNTLSNVAEILEYHGKPMLQVPASVTFGGLLDKGADRAIGIRNYQDANIARYITYDGQLDAQLASLDKSLEMAFLTSEVPRTYFGLGVDAVASSGTSLKLQLQNYLKKAGRWQKRETKRSRLLVDMALRLLGGFEDPAARLAEISHGSPLPVDDEQQVRIAVSAVTGGLMSKESGVKIMERLGFVEDADAEMDLLDAEKEASVALLPPAFGGGNDGNPTARPGQPGQPDAGAQQ